MKEKDYRSIVKDELESYGFTANKPTDMQQDMIYLRNLRLGSESIKKNIRKTIILAVVSTICLFFWDALKGFILK